MEDVNTTIFRACSKVQISGVIFLRHSAWRLALYIRNWAFFRVLNQPVILHSFDSCQNLGRTYSAFREGVCGPQRLHNASMVLQIWRGACFRYVGCGGGGRLFSDNQWYVRSWCTHCVKKKQFPPHFSQQSESRFVFMGWQKRFWSLSSTSTAFFVDGVVGRVFTQYYATNSTRNYLQLWNRVKLRF